ncbi:MAG: CDP-diacylglycerol--glycerol-3-phosphate 3-phosphatidyltransferase [Treponema sp.]|jgi:CDP-diacylglycerol--glycerol-3-phosphate 3-phosphatidyltransferase|nr:CDP-diacylglycerol--glycerol-3-phosphate 3-phosphatidyltransferase [Treponema sp.]
MNLADRITLLRIILAPVFFIEYMLLKTFQTELAGCMIWLVALLWIIAIVAELTDMFDGMAARHYNQTSDFGRLFDPFADTLMQITGFFCFVIDGILPAYLFLVVLYREFGILFIRNLMLRKGITMGARMSGKIKTVTYITAAAVALLYASLIRLSALEFLQPVVKIAAIAVFGLSVFFSVLSFLDYLFVYIAAKKN